MSESYQNESHELTLGDLLRKQRQKQSGILKNYAAGVGITEGQLSRYERNAVDKPDAYLLPKIATVYGLEVQTLWAILETGRANA